MKNFILGVNFRENRKNHRPTLFDRHPGQAIVLVAVMMIVLLGFTGMAVDGGELYFLQRDAQNAADAAILAYLWQWCGHPNDDPVETAVLARDAAFAAAKANGFEDNVNGVDVNIDQATGGDFNLITITITAIKPARLIQVVYNGPLQVTVTTVGRCNPSVLIPHGSAMMGIGQCSPDGVRFNGSGNASIISGGIFSNGGIQLSGSGTSADESSSVTGTNTNGGASGGTTTPVPSPVNIPLIWTMSDFAPGGPIAEYADSFTPSQYHYHIGQASSWSDFGLTSGDPPAGIYYATGGIDFGNTDFTPHPYGPGSDPITSLTGVTLVSPGVITITMPDVEYDHSAYTVDPLLYAAAGIPPVMPVIYSSAGNSTCGNSNDAVAINGKYLWLGAIYAPYGQISISTSSSGTANGALIGYSVLVSASSVQIAYDPQSIPPLPPTVGLER